MDKILVAEDDESIREELTALLRANGYQTVDAPPCDLAPVSYTHLTLPTICSV